MDRTIDREIGTLVSQRDAGAISAQAYRQGMRTIEQKVIEYLQTLGDTAAIEDDERNHGRRMAKTEKLASNILP